MGSHRNIMRVSVVICGVVLLFLIPVLYPDSIIPMLNLTPPKEHFIKPSIVPNSSLIYYAFKCAHPKAAIIYVQGGLSRVFSKLNIKLCMRLNMLHYNVYMFYYRDIPPGITLITSCLNDLNEMYDYVMAQSKLQCVLVGYSFGSVIVSHFKSTISSAVLLAPLGTFNKHVHYLYPFLNLKQNYQIRVMTYPTLILNSSSDYVAPSTISNASYHGNVYFSTLPNLSHFEFNSMSCIQRIDAFITTHL
jgi:hypothetical protein